jgi:hypothetical protein
MRTIDCHKCVACKKKWVNSKTARRRLEWASVMLKRYLDKLNWLRVRFSDEMHFEWDSQEKIYFLRQSDERYCHDCVQHAAELDAKDVKRHHCWVAINHDFKSDIDLYNVSSNANEKMSQRVYIDQILESIIRSWFDRGHDFVLKEDDYSDHESSKLNIVRTWKETHHFESYFNCAFSSDLLSIENCWVVSKQHLRQFSHWNDVTTKDLIVEEWDHLSHHLLMKKWSKYQTDCKQ